MLSRLSTELICIILGQFDSLQDLYSVIRSSSIIYHAFQGTRRTILSQVVRNIFGHEAVMCDALFALRTSQTPPQMESLEMSLVEVEQLCQMWHCHHYFIKDLMVFFSENLNAQLQVMQPAPISDTVIHLSEESLSPLELARLHRSMFRYSAFQRIMTDPLRADSCHDAAGRVRAMFSHYTSWEIEEVACIHDYIKNRLQNVLEEVEDCFVESVREAAQHFAFPYLPDTSLRELEQQSAPWCLAHEDESSFGLESEEAEVPFFAQGDYVFTKGQKINRWLIIQRLSSLGFSCLRMIFEGDPDFQKHMVVEGFENCQSAGLTAALVPSSQHLGVFKDENAGWLSKKVLEFEGDDLRKRNIAWLWANQNRPQANFNRICNTDLREWGYVFWDSDRLRRWGVLDEPRPKIGFHQFVPHYRPIDSLYDRPSAQERLRMLGLA